MNKKRGCQHGLDHESLPAIRHQTLRTNIVSIKIIKRKKQEKEEEE